MPDEQAFEVIKASIDVVPAGSKMLLNSCTDIGRIRRYKTNSAIQPSSTRMILAPGVLSSWLASSRSTRGTPTRFSSVSRYAGTRRFMLTRGSQLTREVRSPTLLTLTPRKENLH